MSALQSYTLPTSPNIKKLRETDFALETKDRICIFNERCTIILFYNESPESKNFLNLFNILADTVNGPVFGTCNVVLEKKVVDAFRELHLMEDHPFSWISNKNPPFVVIYRRGYPVNFYDGPADMEILTKFALNVACNPKYNIHNYEYTKNTKAAMWQEFYDKHPFDLSGENQQPVYEIPARPYNP